MCTDRISGILASTHCSYVMLKAKKKYRSLDIIYLFEIDIVSDETLFVDLVNQND